MHLGVIGNLGPVIPVMVAGMCPLEERQITALPGYERSYTGLTDWTGYLVAFFVA